MAKSFDELANEIKKLNQTLQNLGKGGLKNKDLENALKSFNGDAQAATDFFKILNDQSEELHYTFSGIAETLKNALKDLQGQVNTTKQIEESYRKLTSIADKLRDHQKNNYTLSVKKLENIKEQADEEIKLLKETQKILEKKRKISKLSKKELEYYNKITDALKNQESYLNQITKELEKEVKLEKKRADNLGLTQGMFKGIHGLMKKIGVESEAFDNINKAMREAAGSGGAFKTLMAGAKATVSEMKKSFFSITTSAAIIAKTFSFIKDIAFGFGENVFKLQQNFGVSTKEATRLNEELLNSFYNTENLYSTHEDLIKASIELNNSAGTYNAYGVKALDNFNKLTEIVGLTGDEAAKLQQYGDLYGQSSEEVYNTIGKTKKGLLNNKQVLSQVLKIEGQLAAQYKNNPELLAKAVVQVNKLGMTMEQAKKASSQLLDFESSISAELEAELLTGENLNLEKARSLALQGKTAEAAEELMKNLGPNGLAKFNKMNVFQQEAYAKALGMSQMN
jgi:ribosomal protein L3